jgi:hypothetical protein
MIYKSKTPNIGILVALLLPAVNSARESARRSQCLNKEKQICLSILAFAEANKHFPPASYTSGGEFSYIAAILPYIEEPAAKSLLSLTDKWDNVSNDKASQTLISFLRCPAQDPQEWTNVTVAGSTSFQMTGVAAHYPAVLGADEGCGSNRYSISCG